MPHSCPSETWKCPTCSYENRKHISNSTITNCVHCTESLSWDGTKVVTYNQWLKSDTKEDINYG